MFGKFATQSLYKVLVKAADLLYSACAMGKVQFNCRLDGEVAGAIKSESDRLSSIERRKVSQAELVEKAWRNRERIIGLEAANSAQARAIDELEKLVASLNQGEVPARLGDLELPVDGTQSERVEILKERLEAAIPIAPAPATSSTGANHCVHCAKNFPRPEETKPSSRCQPCAVAGHWNADPGVCQKCKEQAYFEKKASEDKLARATGRSDIVYD